MVLQYSDMYMTIVSSLLTDAINFIVVPTEPRSLMLVSTTSSSVTIQWTSPATLNGVITQYSAQINGTNTDITNFDNNMLMSTIEELSPDTVYVLQLRAHTGAGAGPPSSNITFLTCKLINIRISSFYIAIYYYKLIMKCLAN